ncbi:MAG TPA: NAD(P)/FAD-dependent oxidoreductase [Thermoanaerobaculia bacterium]|nr:NAD(P)/FAD-dependent oxidoreductase [Thermoanaerobaculia bacterium]
MSSAARPRVVIVGAGFAGLEAAKRLAGADVSITIVDRRNFHLFQPLLDQVATGGLSPGQIASPLRAVLARQKNATVLLGEMVDLDAEGRRVLLADGEVPYDTLILAPGATHHYFGRDDWESHAPGLKTIEDATGIRSRLFLAFEAAEREPDEARRRAWLTFAVVGAGATGVELAGALAEISRETLRHDFRRIDPREASILLVEAADRVLPPYPPELSAKAGAALAGLGVRLLTGTRVTALDAGGLTLDRGGTEERIPARTVMWAAGVRASPLGAVLRDRAGAELDRAGRVLVGPDLALPGRPEIHVLGDLAHCLDERGSPLPGIAPVAMQQGRWVAAKVRSQAKGQRPKSTFRYRDKGTMAVIGRGSAVAVLGPLRVAGYPAWLAWLFVHLLYLVEFENRLLVLLQWAWNYFTWNRGARLITGPSPFPLARGGGGDPPAPSREE